MSEEEVVEEAVVKDAADIEKGDAGPSEFVLSLSKPISAGEPCGENARYEDAFEKVKSEFDKLADIDYEMIKDLSLQLLTETTKDILVGSYLAVSLIHLDGLQGLSEGTAVLNMLTDTFWDGLHPKKPVAKANALKFFAQKSGDELETLSPSLSDGSTLDDIESRLKTLQSFTMEAMGEHAPQLSGLVRIVGTVKRKVPKPAAPKATAASGAAPAKPSAGAGALDAINSDAAAYSAIKKASTFLQKNDWQNAAGYRTIRANQWGMLRKLPPMTGGATSIEPPRKSEIDKLQKLLSESDYQLLLEASERLFVNGTGRFYLDIQRFTVVALESLGEEYELAKRSVMEETALFVNQYPGIRQMLFNDGTPFVTVMCADWLDSDVLPLLSGSSDSPGGNSGGGLLSANELFEEDKKEAKGKLQKGDLDAAISLIQSGTETDTTSKQRFIRQLFLADLCVKGERADIARAILEKLDAVVERYDLAQWDPALALNVLSLLRSTYISLSSSANGDAQKNLIDKADSTFERICHIDASFALSVE